ncbi:MAG: hypothetical protein ACI8TQ_003201 [Planctomycetota bacterium]|jgi:hypothetical protein
MAKKKTMRVESESDRKKRHRRSPEEIIEDLQSEIKRLRAKSTARAIKESPAVKLTLASLRSIDKGLDAAASESNSHLRHALADARRSLSGYLEKQGIKLPKARLPKGPRPKDE